jgi:hypothetical protein
MIVNYIAEYIKLEAQWAEPVSLIFHSVLRKLYTEPSKVLPTKPTEPLVLYIQLCS